MFEKIIAKTPWHQLLLDECTKEYFKEIERQILADIALGKTIYPRGVHVFRALERAAPDQVRVVILGQDPYHGIDQANGLAFSVSDGIPIPPSLLNIYKELQDDLGCPIPHHGVLDSWAGQGVLLLNTALTVVAHHAASHSKIGWHQFTDAIIEKLSTNYEHIVFIFWGSHAQSKASLIDTAKHHIIRSVHPSPLSAYRGFFGSKPFSKANNYLTSWGRSPIQWCIR